MGETGQRDEEKGKRETENESEKISMNSVCSFCCFLFPPLSKLNKKNDDRVVN